MNIKKYLFETIKYALRSYPIIRPYIKEVDRLYTMNAEELKQRNEKRFLEIFRRAYDKSPFYHKLYTEEANSERRHHLLGRHQEVACNYKRHGKEACR